MAEVPSVEVLEELLERGHTLMCDAGKIGGEQTENAVIAGITAGWLCTHWAKWRNPARTRVIREMLLKRHCEEVLRLVDAMPDEEA